MKQAANGGIAAINNNMTIARKQVVRTMLAGIDPESGLGRVDRMAGTQAS